MDHIFNDTDDLLSRENKSLVKYNAKQSDALRRVIKEVRDHRHKHEMAEREMGDLEQAGDDLYRAVEEIASEFGGLYGTV